MRGGILPPALLCFSLALALAFVPRREALGLALLTAVIALVLCLTPLPATLIEPIFIGCWGSVIASAALVYWPGGAPRKLLPFAAANAGIWVGAVSRVAGSGSDLLVALSLLLVAVAARSLVERGWSIALKIAASWMIAVATLATMVSLTPTPGYVADHMD